MIKKVVLTLGIILLLASFLIFSNSFTSSFVLSNERISFLAITTFIGFLLVILFLSRPKEKKEAYSVLLKELSDNLWKISEEFYTEAKAAINVYKWNVEQFKKQDPFYLRDAAQSLRQASYFLSANDEKLFNYYMERASAILSTMQELREVTRRYPGARVARRIEELVDEVEEIYVNFKKIRKRI